MFLYELSPKSAVDPAPDWWSEYRAALPCPECQLTVPREMRLAGAEVHILGVPRDTPLTRVSPPAVLMARRDLIDLFASEIARHLNLGPVFRESGELLPEWQSLVSEKPLLIRGGPKSIRYVCPRCGRLRYGATGDVYVLRRDLNDQPIYEAKGRLVVASELRARIEKGRWKGIWISKLPVRDEPLDGLPLIIPNRSY